jgi:8-oxo-dGTP pyrophosphatase MutT (NUDIX family)
VTVEPRDAATVLLVRDATSGPGIEIFMLRRNPRSAFVADAHVFPGGAVDAEDRARSTTDLVHGVDAVGARRRLGRVGALAFWVAGIRETFEEAGVLLARERATHAPVQAAVAAALDGERAPVADGRASFANLVRAHDLVLDGGALRVLSRWITPSPAPRRYDTWFFVAPAPPDHAYVHDDDEAVASEWLGAGEALDRSRRGEVDLIYPTYRTLQTVVRFASCDELIGALDDAWAGPGDVLQMVGANGWQARLPGDGLDDDAEEADARLHAVTGRRGGR